MGGLRENDERSIADNLKQTFTRSREADSEEQDLPTFHYEIQRAVCQELCQGIGLRGHRDDAESEALNQGNFRALLNLCV